MTVKRNKTRSDHTHHNIFMCTVHSGEKLQTFVKRTITMWQVPTYDYSQYNLSSE